MTRSGRWRPLLPCRWCPDAQEARRRPCRPPAMRPPRSRFSTAWPTICFAWCPRPRRRSASTPARERRCESQLADRSAEGQQRLASAASRRPRRASTPSTRPASRMRRAPASRSCAAPTRRRSKGSRCRTATSRSAAGATRRTSSFRTSARISTSRASSTAIIAIENAADAEAYLARLQSYAKQLDGELGRMQAARAAGLVPPAFLIDKALAQMTLSAKNAREGGTLVESIERRTKNIPGDWADARADDRRAGSRAGARAPVARAAGAARGRHERRRHLGAAARRGVLPVGAQGLDDHDACRPTRSTRWAGASCERLHGADGRDPEGDRLHARHRRRADEGAGEGSALQVLRRRQGPRRDHGVHQQSPRRGSGRRCRARSTRSSIRTWK